jgi:hypothetical protein
MFFCVALLAVGWAVEDTLTILVKELPHFGHDLGRGAFRRWLRNITFNRTAALLAGAPAPFAGR